MVERAGGAWSDREVEAAVRLYLRMLDADLRGEGLVKAQAYRELVATETPARTAKAVEYKLQNISAVMTDLGLPRVAGLLPLRHIQSSLTATMREQLLAPARAPLLDRLVDLAAERAAGYAVQQSQLVVPPPPRDSDRPAPLPDARHFDWDEAERRRLGLLGEQWVVEFERSRLAEGGRGDLAEQVEHTSVEQGDGAGFDIRSFDPDGEARLIEVKTTASTIGRAFLVTRNELAVSQREARHYWLYRVFGFWGEPRMYQLRGALDATLELVPTTYSGLPSAGPHA